MMKLSDKSLYRNTPVKKKLILVSRTDPGLAQIETSKYFYSHIERKRLGEHIGRLLS